MERIIKFSMSNGRSLSLPMSLAEQVIDNPRQIVKIMQKGVWTGKVINKAHLVEANFDIEAENQQRELDRIYKSQKRIEERLPSPGSEAKRERQQRIKRIIQKQKEELAKKLGWNCR